MTYPVEYEAHVWNDVKNIEEVVHGVTFGDTYGEAMNNIEDYYGNDIISVKLYMLEAVNEPLYEFEINSQSDFHGMLQFESIKTHDGY